LQEFEASLDTDEQSLLCPLPLVFVLMLSLRDGLGVIEIGEWFEGVALHVSSKGRHGDF
jgi:hypothetical protein